MRKFLFGPRWSRFEVYSILIIVIGWLLNDWADWRAIVALIGVLTLNIILEPVEVVKK